VTRLRLNWPGKALASPAEGAASIHSYNTLNEAPNSKIKVQNDGQGQAPMLATSMSQRNKIGILSLELLLSFEL
jgi:hypothetical protein